MKDKLDWFLSFKNLLTNTGLPFFL